MKTCRGSFLPLGVTLVLLGAGILGCGQAEPSARFEDAPALEPQAAGDACVTFQGNTHCPLGAATLFKNGNQSLRVGNMFAAGDDGVAIHLPEVTEFSARAMVKPAPDGLHIVARSISEGVSTSSMTTQQTDDGYAVSATFTGDATTGTYNVNLYNNDVLVQSLDAVMSGETGFTWNHTNCAPGSVNYPMCLSVVISNTSGFRVVQGGADAGACVWTVGGPESADMLVQLPNGEVVIADRIDLVEQVDGSGSYPYLTFDRIDYTASGGPITITRETVQ